MDTNKIAVSTKYSDFKRIIGNRTVDQKHVRHLKESMQINDLKIPITCNENMEVIDGQHRLQARKELNIPVYYIVVKGLGIDAMQRANANNKNWTLQDFLSYYCELNYYNYKELKKFIDKFKFGIGESEILLGGRVGPKEFAAGQFSISDLEFAYETAEKIYQIQPYYKNFKRRSFILAIGRLLKNKDFDFEEFIQKLSYQSSKMVDCTTTFFYIDLIEEIYNYKRKAEEKVRFR